VHGKILKQFLKISIKTEISCQLFFLWLKLRRNSYHALSFSCILLKIVSCVATIYDIAKAANTSPASVSRVINDRGGVRADTMERIKQVMEKLDFRPRWKVLDRDRFLIFVPEHRHFFDDGYVARIMSGIADASFPAGFGLQLRPFSSPGKNVQDLRHLFMQESVAGCILISMYQGYSLAAQLDLSGLPHVVVGHKREDKNDHQILLDDFVAGREAAEFLLSLGHKRIAMVSFSHRDHCHLERYQGFAETIVKAVNARPVCLQCDDVSYEAGRSTARQLLSPLERPTAVIITNEDLAVGFQAEAKAMGFSVPGDLSLIGFEETDKLLLLDTPITVMQTPAYAMGLESVKMLRAEISGKENAASSSSANYLTKHMSIPLLVRHSTAAIRP
jgi:DNA-binding LacI/PurR family transcriptional regulator